MKKEKSIYIFASAQGDDSYASFGQAGVMTKEETEKGQALQALAIVNDHFDRRFGEGNYVLTSFNVLDND